MRFPKHMYLRLVHNPHAVDYQPLERWLEHQLLAAEAGGIPRDEAIAPADLAAIRSTGEVWVLSWCPDTPVGSCEVIAASLERVLELASAAPTPADPAFYLHRLDRCGCGHRRGDHEGPEPQPCMWKRANGDAADCPCAAFALAEAHDPLARALEGRG